MTKQKPLEYKRFNHTPSWVGIVLMACLIVTVKLAQVYNVMWLLNAAGYATLPVAIFLVVRQYQFDRWMRYEFDDLVTAASRKRQAEEAAEAAKNEISDTLGRQWGVAPSRTPATDRVDDSYTQARNLDRFQ